ncbi:hypothetical protein, partial [Mesorhizobium sp.]|uniref:hypothetical protein n=1 Tax=Mesorhizobium sp. TaxID=1871066 RepID=UPI0025E6E5C4
RGAPLRHPARVGKKRAHGRLETQAVSGLPLGIRGNFVSASHAVRMNDSDWDVFFTKKAMD